MEWKSTQLVQRVHPPQAALPRHAPRGWAVTWALAWCRTANLTLKGLVAAKTSLPKDNSIILIIRCPVMIKCLLLAPHMRSFLLTCCLLWQTTLITEKAVFYWKEATKSYLSPKVEKVQLINLFLSLTSRHNRFYSTAIYCNYRMEQVYTVACIWVCNEEWKIDVQCGQMTNKLLRAELVEQE